MTENRIPTNFIKEKDMAVESDNSIQKHELGTLIGTDNASNPN